MTRLLDPARPLALLAACPAYQPTPLTAARIAGRAVWVKDETARMGLGAFKAMGGVYAVARLIEAQAGRPIAPAEFLSAEVQAIAAGLTFVCASAGNHGMAVAAGARIFGARAQVLLSETVPDSFAARLHAQGAEVIRAGATYEDSVAAAITHADQTGAIHLADGSWPGYTDPPRLVMEGYTVIAQEMRSMFEADNSWPDHVYLQAGVGGLAAAIAAMIRQSWAVQPKITVVEPQAAPCLQASVAAGKLVTVDGPVSDMGRLDCKTPSMLAFDILRDAADHFITISEAEAAKAVEDAQSAGLQTTPSGAAGLAAALKGADMRPLVILSEGATDAA